MYRVQGGSEAVPHHVGQEETVVVLIELPDAVEVAPHDIVRNVVR